MENAIVISKSLVNRLKNMSREECMVLFDTLLCDEVLNVERTKTLTPMQELMYMMVRDYVMKDSRKYSQATEMQSAMVSA